MNIPMRTRSGGQVLINVDLDRLGELGLAPLDRVSTKSGKNGTVVGFGFPSCPCHANEQQLFVRMDNDDEPLLFFRRASLYPPKNDKIGIPSSIIDTFTRYSMSFIRRRATEICIALQSMKLPALVTQTLLDAACPLAELVPFHKKWNLVTTVKHYK